MKADVAGASYLRFAGYGAKKWPFGERKTWLFEAVSGPTVQLNVELVSLKRGAKKSIQDCE